ncbi:MAG: zinc ABC transporter substrate-binding protein, partial [Deltaproteobacteria bacterium]|nr:zinc ABC transporter substrate-binding protein [Deltaproteobacteria bacterium]
WFLLAGWSGPAEGKLRVVTTTSDLKAIAEAVGGDRVTVDSLLRGYQNPHDLEVRPSYMLKVQRADIFIRIGLDHDPWADPIVEGSRNRNIFRGAPGHVDVSQGIPLLEVPTGKIDRSQGDIHSFGNTHYWLDPENAKTIARTIATGFQRVSPQDAAVFSANLQRFR